MRVTVAYAAPGVEAIETLTLHAGATVAEAVAASGLVGRYSLPASVAYAIHGQRAKPDTPLAEGDRVELVRPLVADAKAMRRERAANAPLPRTRKVKRRAPPG